MSVASKIHFYMSNFVIYKIVKYIDYYLFSFYNDITDDFYPAVFGILMPKEI
jgi:hypothetical protein